MLDEGVVYETLAMLSPTRYLCRRSLVEIKTPWKLLAWNIVTPAYFFVVERETCVKQNIL